MTRFKVCSEEQRERGRGCYAVRSTLEYAIATARHYAKQQKKRMYVVVLRRRP